MICVLTHDPKFDVPVLELALRLPEVAYVGRDGIAAHPRRPARAAARGRADRGRADPALQPDRARPRGAHARGDSRSASPPRSSPGRWGGTGDRLSVIDGRIHAHATPRASAGRGTDPCPARQPLPAPATTCCRGPWPRRSPTGSRGLRRVTTAVCRRPGSPSSSRSTARCGSPGTVDEGDRFDPDHATSYDVIVAGLHPVAARVEQPTAQAGVQLALHPLAARAAAGLPGRRADRAGRPRPRGARPRGGGAARPGGAAQDGDEPARRRAAVGALPRRRRPRRSRAARGGPGLAAARGGHGGRCRVEDVAREVMLSPRQLRTLMVAELGLSPKQLSRSSASTRVIAQLADGCSSLAEVAAATGLRRPEPPHPRVPADGRLHARRSGWSRSAETSKTAATATGQTEAMTDRALRPQHYRRPHRVGHLPGPRRPGDDRLPRRARLRGDRCVRRRRRPFVHHAQLDWPEGGGVMFGSHKTDRACSVPPGGAGFYVVTADPRAVHERAVGAGAEITRELNEPDYGGWEFGLARPRGQPVVLRQLPRRAAPRLASSLEVGLEGGAVFGVGDRHSAGRLPGARSLLVATQRQQRPAGRLVGVGEVEVGEPVLEARRQAPCAWCSDSSGRPTSSCTFGDQPVTRAELAGPRPRGTRPVVARGVGPAAACSSSSSAVRSVLLDELPDRVVRLDRLHPVPLAGERRRRPAARSAHRG